VEKGRNGIKGLNNWSMRLSRKNRRMGCVGFEPWLNGKQVNELIERKYTGLSNW
jgi:hypothetical protein